MNQLSNIINQLTDYQRDNEKTIRDIQEKNSSLTKTIATVRSILERSLKNPGTLNSSVYECIDLCRANFIYLDYSTGKTKCDPPLNESEKILP